MQLESSLERCCKRAAEQAGGLFIKMERRKGWPDRILILPDGRHIWVELKAKRGRLSPLQRYVKKKLTWYSCSYWIVNSKEDFDALLAELDPK